MNRARYVAVVFFVAASVMIQLLAQPPSASAAVDLVASSVTWSPNPAKETDAVSITVKLKNRGGSGAGPFHVQLTRDGASSCGWTITSLAAGKSINRTCAAASAIPSASLPGHAVTLAVDDRRQIAESSESNNTKTVSIPVAVATPTITPNGGTFLDLVTVTLATITQEAAVRYTTDGTTPTAGSTQYTEPFLLTGNATVKARAFKTGAADSAEASATFTVQRAADTLRFTDRTQAAGFVLSPDRGGWHGSYVADYDNDGDEDLFMTSHGIRQLDDTGWDALFRNNGNGQFTDVAASAGVQGAAIYGRFTRELHGAAWIDYDNDGDLDLYMPDTDSDSLESGPNRHATDELYENNGDGTFARVSTARGFPALGRLDYARRGVVAGDFNLDGFTDLFVLQMIFIENGRNKPIAKNVVPVPYRAVYFNQAGQSFCLEGQSGCPERTGVEYTGWSQGATSLDYDNDGDVDVLESDEDYGTGLRLWDNDGNGHFAEVAAAKGLPGPGTKVNCATAGDVDNDGDQDVYVRVDGVGRLYRNDGGRFIHVSSFGGAEHMFFADLDNDGDLDLVSGGVFLNDGRGSFGPNQAPQLGVMAEGRGGMAFDADGDGDLDILLNRSDRYTPYLLYYVNELAVTAPGARWLKVKLAGPQGQAGAPGAKVFVYDEGFLGDPGHLLGYREVTTATGFVSGASPIQHFGLGGRTAVDVQVRFLAVRDQAGNLVEKVVEQRSVSANTTVSLDGRSPPPM